MFIISSYTFSPGEPYEGSITVGGIYQAENFAAINNVTRNIPLYIPNVHETTVVTDEAGGYTTVFFAQNTSFCLPTDNIQIVCYPTNTGGGTGQDVNVLNFPPVQTVDGTVTVNQGTDPWSVAGTVSVDNFPATQTVSGSVSVSGTVSVDNFPATQEVTQGTSPWEVSGTVDVGNLPATYPVTGSVDVGNFPAVQAVSGTVDVGNLPATYPVTGTVDVGNFPATQEVTQGTTPWVVSGTTTTTVSSFPTTSTDAFNRLRVSQPFTLFDSWHRYADNGLWATDTANGGSATFSATEGLVNLTVTGVTGSRVYRETTKVFPYQPGKSLLVDNTFVFSAPQVGLRQRFGYFGTDNGYFLETDGLDTYFVERSLSQGGETRVLQADWNVDPMDGTGPSGLTLDISKAQIMWMDLQWLGEGTVRMGFEINGQAYLCHQWNHANLIATTYITTACLPLRIEVENTGDTGTASTLKQVCSTVISEGGYTLTGSQQSVGTPITTPRSLAIAGTYYPIVSLRLKSTRLDAVAILSAISLMGNGNNERFEWRVVASGTVAGGTWEDAGANSSVEYNLTGTGITGGRVLASGYTSSSNQGSPTIDILKQALLTFQLERDPFTATPYTLTIAMAGANNSTTCYASMDFEEVSR